ncbi:Tolloid-like protein 1 [Nymphon striatum]|nr:Tolloid-like protein 1 [Nymphon striatum]
MNLLIKIDFKIDSFCASRAKKRINCAVDACNQTISHGLTKIVTPPANKKNIGFPLECSYIFQAEKAHNTFWKIKFHRFSISSPEKNCSEGYVKIHDGESADNSSLGRLCGTFDRKHEYISESANLTIIFFSANFTKGQFIEFEAEDEPKWNLYRRFGQYPQLNPNRRGHHVSGTYCDRVMSKDECSNGWCHIQSPGFPGFYLPNLTCHYLIQVHDTFAKLTLSSIDVDAMQCDGVECFPRILSWNEDCSKDYVRLYDGSSTSSPIIATICGRAKSKQEIVASSTIMLVEFVTSEIGSLTNYGFEFRAAGTSAKKNEIARPSESCDVNHNLLNTDRVYFHSIKHWYPKNTTCFYRVSGMPHELLEITFYEFQVGKDSSFCTNYLMIYDSLQPDPKRSHDALQFGYSFPGTLCDESFLIAPDSSGNFSSPRNFLKFQSFERSVSCTYKFTATSLMYQRVSVTFSGMFEEKNQDCSQCYGISTGYIEAYEGKPNPENMLACICGVSDTRPITFSITSEGPEITLIYIFTPRLIKQFPSKFGRAQVMFEGYYRLFHGPRCGPVEYPSTLDGFLEYPPTRIFQGLYFQKTRCIWKINRDVNKDLFIKVLELFLHGNCETDYLEIRSTKLPNDLAWKLCGNSSNTVFQRVILRQEIMDSSIEIELLSSQQGNTFNITWTQVDYHESMQDPQALVQDCTFYCQDRDNILCLDRSLICNGINNCPQITDSTGLSIDEVECEKEKDTVWEFGLAALFGCVLAVFIFTVMICVVCIYQRHCKNQKLDPIKQVYSHPRQCSTYTIS